jgi:hypothetical protein
VEQIFFFFAFAFAFAFAPKSKGFEPALPLGEKTKGQGGGKVKR